MSTNSLRETIENFQNYVLDKDNALIEHSIQGLDAAFKQTRLDVYHAAYSLRLLEVLSLNFAMLKVFVGEELFERLGRDYIHSYPSNHFSVRFFGRHFSQFLTTHPEATPVLAELADFEWALGQTLDAKDAPQLTFEQMAALDPDAWANLKLTLHPSLRQLNYFYPTPKLWQALSNKTEHPVLEPEEKPVTWIMWRFNLKSHFCTASPEQLWMLEAMQSGQTFSEICAGLCDWLTEDKVVSFAAETLRQWITEGIFSEFEV
ncbi:MAG TPA: DNA-binding domain-containing protein [Gammaproteobacteria bacterium]|nr:DNA-binding domain-containing protein [Gammaproteobacteria bacterium]